MTFNIRYGSAKDGINHWNNRKSLVIDRIKAFSPDLLGMQECRDDDQAEFIKNNLQEYEFYGVQRGGKEDTALEMAPILFKKSTFRVTQKECFWLSDTPHIPGSKYQESVFPRTVLWVKLIHQETGKQFIFINTHFDYDVLAINKSAEQLQQWLVKISKRHPIILTGDFNAEKNFPVHHRLTKQTSLLDAYKQLHPHSDQGTFHEYGQLDQFTSIDWILVSHHFNIESAHTDRHHIGDLYPSDHFPVTTTLQLK